MENEDALTSCDDVTIYLVKKLVTDEVNREKKRRKLEDGLDSGTTSGEILDEIHANSQKLRRCSKYFEACMSERWTLDAATESSSRSVFYLEVQTEISYYEDCFLRMSFAFPKPIPSVTYCIELLKVATQIQCEDLLDMGMKFLGGVSWGDDDEKLIRDFCNSGHFAADSASDLKARLGLLLTKEERLKKFAEGFLFRRYLCFALSHNPTCDTAKGTLDSHKVFADVLDVVVSDLKSDMSRKLLEYVMTLLKEAGERILNSFKNLEFRNDILEDGAVNFCWLYHMSRKGNASHLLVKLLVKHDNKKLYEEHDEELNEADKEVLDGEHVQLNVALGAASRKLKIAWAGMVYKIFKELLDGQLLLNTSERSALFWDWIWILEEEYMEDINEEDLVKFITNIVLTFPLPEQYDIYNGCGHTFDGSVISQSQTAWLMLMVKKVAEGGPKIRALEDCKDTCPPRKR